MRQGTHVKLRRTVYRNTLHVKYIKSRPVTLHAVNSVHSLISQSVCSFMSDLNASKTNVSLCSWRIHLKKMYLVSFIKAQSLNKVAHKKTLDPDIISKRLTDGRSKMNQPRINSHNDLKNLIIERYNKCINNIEP